VDLRQAYRALDPAHPIAPDSPFYARRLDSPVDLTIGELKLSEAPRWYLLAGHRGSGKTTELARIAQALAKSHTVVRVECSSQDHTVLEQALENIVAKLETLTESSRRATTVLRSSFVFEDERDAGVRTPRMLRWLHENPPPFSEPLVVLLDGLDKLDLPHIRDAFGALHSTLGEESLSVVCTIPLFVTLDPDFGELARLVHAWHFLPSIDLWTRDGERIDAGWKTCRDVLERRAEGLLSDEALELLIEQGAGIHRELLRLAQRACALAAVAGETSVDLPHVERAVHEIRNEYSIMLRSEDHRLLAEVDRTGRISADPRLLRLVRDQFVVSYGGGGAWFSVHPMVRPLIVDGEKAAFG